MNKLAFIICCVAISLRVGAQQTDLLKSGKENVKLLHATLQRTLPGRNTGVITDYDFILVWKSKEAPQYFFWRGQDGWLTCSIQKVHAAGKKNGSGYVPDKAGLTATIHRGDTLDLKPIRGGRFAVPQQVTDTVVNTLFFETTGSGLRYFKVSRINQKPDIILP